MAIAHPVSRKGFTGSGETVTHARVVSRELRPAAGC
jgi:hypothetical protein